MFASFDLTNFTAFKFEKPHIWPKAIIEFYQELTSQMKTELPSFEKWKALGDEMLFYSKLSSRKEAHENLVKLHRVMCAVIDRLNGNASLEAKNIISVKAVAWIAAVCDCNNTDDKYSKPRNVKIHDPVFEASGQMIYDFIGPDIDIFARIAKFSDMRKIILSAHLAKLIIDTDANKSQNLRLLKLERLKGVYKERPYPIIWYYDNWNKISDSFYYDQDSEIVNIARTGKHLKIRPLLRKICSDLNINTDLDLIYKILDTKVRNA